MNTEQLVAHIDEEIARLQRARDLLAGSEETKRRARSPGTEKKQAKKRILSATARQKISEAQRKRWAAQKKQSR